MATKSVKNMPSDSKAKSLKKAATSAKGRSKQKKGSSEHNTEPRYAKKSKNPDTSPMSEMEF